MREYTKALEAIQHASDHDTDRKHSSEIAQQELKLQQALYSQRGEESQEETLERAMRDPEVAVSSLPRLSAVAAADSFGVGDRQSWRTRLCSRFYSKPRVTRRLCRIT